MYFPPAPAYRSIEIVDDRYYIVARILDENGELQGGLVGLLLDRVAFNEYHLTNGEGIYRIAESGDLLGYSEGDDEPYMICKPIGEFPR